MGWANEHEWAEFIWYLATETSSFFINKISCWLFKATQQNVLWSTTVSALFCFVFFFQGPNNEILFLELDLLETTCHILNPTPLANCSVRKFEEHVSIWNMTCLVQECKFSMLMLEASLWPVRILSSACKSYITVTAHKHQSLVSALLI